ncbi:MAG: phosphate ABC transporter permease subunit PstC [Candidatus Binataceae bacterium]
MAELGTSVAENVGVVGRETRRARRAHVRLFGDRLFNLVTLSLGLVILLVLLGLGFALTVDAMPAIRKFGLSFLFSSDWDPVNDVYGALPFIYGTALSSAIALTIAVPLSLGVALCLSEMAPVWLSRRLGFLVDLLAAIPSVVYGLWAIFILGPWLRDHVESFLGAHLGFLPLFAGPRVSVGMFTAGVVLAIMVIPYVSSVCTEVFRVVPQTQREAAIALGATKWETVRIAVLPYGLSGIIGAIILGLGRALGETIAVAMVIGNSPQISASLFAPAATLASVIANEFAEATTDLYVSSLIELGLVLLGLGVVLHIIARVLVSAVARQRFDNN